MLRYHRDQHHSDLQLVQGDHGGTFYIISRAHEVLIDPITRRELNNKLSMGLHAKQKTSRC